MPSLLLSVLSLGNIILSAAIVIVSFSLFLYLVAHNHRNSVARSFSALLAFLAIVYVGDMFLQRVSMDPGGAFGDAVIWLKFKWLGIAFIPACYLHFSDAVLRATHAPSRFRRVAIVFSYGVSLLFLVLVALSDLVVRDGFFFPQAAQFKGGPLFPLFALFFFALTGWGFYNLRSARERTLTPTTHRRMTYLAAAFLAPAFGVFPYLIFASFPAELSPWLLLLVTLIGKMGIGTMIVVMAYTVAYQGALSPDRIIKHDLIHFLLRGPLVATAVMGLMLSVPNVERWIGLSRETVMYALVIAAIVVLELAINLGKPFIDLFVFWGDRDELTRIQQIDRRLLTTRAICASCSRTSSRPRAISCACGPALSWRRTTGSGGSRAALGPRESLRQFLGTEDLFEVIGADGETGE